MKEASSDDRIEYIDVAKGIAISFMVLCHFSLLYLII